MREGARYTRFELFVRLRRQDEQMILNAILHAAISSARDAPVEGQLEIAEGLRAEKVLYDCRMRSRLEAAVFNGPGVAGRSLLPRVHPSVHGLSIEQQNPASRPLLRSQCVRIAICADANQR